MVSAGTVLITGAGSRLGRSLAEGYAADGWTVIALPGASGDHDPLADGSAEEVAQRLAGRAIDVAILCDERPGEPDLAAGDVGGSGWEEVMVANTFAPLHLAALLEPNLRAGTRPTLVALTSRSASITLGEGRRDFVHRASKAALNQMWRTLSVEWRDWGCLCLLLDPAGGPDAEVAADLRRLIAGAGPDRSGQALARDGSVLPW